MILADFKKVGFFCGFICLMVSLIFIFGYTARAETKYIESETGQTCADLCEADQGENGEPLYCVGMTVGREWQDHRYCDILNGNGLCEKTVGGCNTVLLDQSSACDNPYSDNDCYNQQYRQASWTDCLCRTSETPIWDNTGEEDVFEDIGANVYTDPWETHYIYQGFDSPTNDIGKITRFSTFIGSIGWDGTPDDILNQAYFKIGFYFADSVNDCFAFEVQKRIDCVFGCGEDNQYSMFQVPANPDGTLRAENYWELNSSPGYSIYDSAGQNEFFCGIGIFPYHTTGATSSIIVLTQPSDTLPDSYIYGQSRNAHPLSFKLHGEETQATTTPGRECLCDDIATSTGWLEEISNAISWGVQCSIRKTTCWLLTPSADSLDNFATSTHTLSESFPFNTLYGLTNPIKESADIEMNSTTTSSLKMPMVNQSGHYYLLTVASSTSVAGVIGATNANSWRVGIAYVIWAMFAGLVFMIIF